MTQRKLNIIAWSIVAAIVIAVFEVGYLAALAR